MKKLILIVVMMLALVGCDAEKKTDVTAGDTRFVTVSGVTFNVAVPIIDSIQKEGWTLVSCDHGRYWFVRKQ